jgi:acyl-coenzyme A thioesterase PaaI-like protein
MLLGPTLKLRLFGMLKIPLIGYVRPRVERLDAEEVTIRIPLSRRAKNHWGSMYFGALAIGADLAAGSHAMFAIDAEHGRSGIKVGFVFKDVAGEFLRRPDHAVRFHSRNGKAVVDAVDVAVRSGERVNIPVAVECESSGEIVANFTLTLSLKRKD